MSYEYSGDGDERDTRGSYGEGRHHGQDNNQREQYTRNDEGNVETGGYGRDAERVHGQRERVSSSGGYSPEARQNLQAHGFEERTSEYDRPQGHQGGGGQSHGQDQGRHQNENQGRRHGEEPESYGTGGRSAIGSGETYVGLDRTGDENRRTADSYGGESANYGSMNSNQGASGGTYVSGSGDKWKPGQTMVFQAAETETEKNPYAGDAVQLAGETQGAAKDGIKQLESWVETKAKELIGKGNH